MKVPIALLLACAATLCVPAVLALPGVPDVAVPEVPEVAAPAVQLPDVPLEVPDAEVGVGAGVHVDGMGVETTVGDPSAAGAGSDASLETAASSHAVLSPKVVAVAQQAAGSALLTYALVAYSSGLDSMRALFARPSARLQQAGRFLLRLVPFLPLFSRIETAKVLDNPVRARVHETVLQDPGLSVEEIRARSGVAWGTAVHHLRRLEDTGLLVSVTHNARRRYFAANTAASQRRGHVAALAHPTARRVAELVRQRPGVGQTELCETLGLRNPAASKHLGQLAQQGLVLPERVGRSCHYHPTAALHAAFGVLEVPMAPALAYRAPATPAAV
ncbi:MAG TPA: hypothetical protein VM286_05450 [Candidatus Thermoplasmatota archaeon]|nr:hypothetical protein [Candidatus Thermoplasmatota archaeon]